MPGCNLCGSAYRPTGMTRSLVAACLIAGLVLAGCGVPAEPGSTPATGAMSTAEPDAGTTPDPDPSSTTKPAAGGTLAERLLGRSFETRGEGDVAGYDLVSGSALSIGFFPTQDGSPGFGGGAGCNSMGGPAIWDGDTVRAGDDFAQTEMACEGLMDQEGWFSALLHVGLTLSLDGDYLTATSTDGAVEIIFVDAAVLHPDIPLVGMTWRLDAIVKSDGMPYYQWDVTASLTISQDPADGHLRLDVFDGLTWLSAPGGFDAATGAYSGSVAIEPADSGDPLEATAGTVRVTGGLGGDSIGCPKDQPDCRIAEMSLLGGDFTFETHRDTLTITGLGDDADQGLTFTADTTAPVPDRNTYLAEADNPLLGKTFELTRTFTDDGGADRKHADATLRLTFGADRVTADGSCGPFTYAHVRYIADPAEPASLQYVDLGKPGVAGCVIGDDPPGPPDGKLTYGTGDDELYLSTGFVAWYFSTVG